MLEEFAQFLVLAVREGIHRINDNCLNALAGAAPQNVVHDGHNIGHALARAGAARQDVGFTLLGLEDRLTLVGVKQ